MPESKKTYTFEKMFLINIHKFKIIPNELI